MNPYPYFDDSWNRILLGLAGANVLALLLWIALGEEVNLGRLSDPSWVPGVGGLALLFLFAACILATVALWISMWAYWARSGKPLMWMLLLLVGAWGPAIAFLFMVYRRDFAAYKQHEAEERMNLTHF
jgi:hypothetical protein